jgi:O-antigen ligase
MIREMALERRTTFVVGAAVVFIAADMWVFGRSMPFGFGLLLGASVLIPLCSAAVRRPVLAVVAFVALLPLGSIGLPFATSLAQITAAFTAVIVLAARITGRGRLIGWSPVIAASALLVLSALLSTLTSVDLNHSLRQTANYLIGLALAAAVVAATERRTDLLMVAMAVVVGGAVLCGSALTSVPRLEAHYNGTLVDNRPVGIFAEPNQLGLSAAIVLCFGIAMTIVTLRQRRTTLSMLCGITSVLALTALVLTLSRGAWIGAFVGLAVLVVLLRGARKPLLICLMTVGVVVLVVLVALPATSGSPVFAERLTSIFTGERSPYDERPAAWAGSLQQMAQRPVLGSGPAAYHAAATQGLAQFTDVRQVLHAHVLYLTVGAEQGVLGLAALVIVIGVGARAALRNRGALANSTSSGRGTTTPSTEAMVSGVSAATAAALTVVLAEGVVDYALRDPVLGTMTWLLIGLLAACVRTRSAIPQSNDPEVAEMKRLTFDWNGKALPKPEKKDSQNENAPPSAHPNRRAILAGLLAGLLVLGTGLAVIAQQPTRYAATSTVSFAPRSQPAISADIVRLAAGKYAVTAGAKSTLDSAARGNSMTTSQLRDDLAVSVQQETSNVDIQVTAADPADAAGAANAVAATVARKADRDRLISGEVTAPADPDAAKRKPSRTLLMTVAIVAAVLAGGWTAFGVRHISRRAAKDAR